MTPWSSAQIEVAVEYDDFMRAHEKALENGKDPDVIWVCASVDIEEVLEEATVDQLRDALGRQSEGYTTDQLIAIEDCFSAIARGDVITAEAMLTRMFEHRAQIEAAENGLRCLHRRAA